ncbi:MAG: hypothetical protein KJ051_06000 [Thermoleophilia bacterium]|nr:hypothetical protein [Thermoleophilia bacterium]
MSVSPLDPNVLRSVAGYLVADARGRVVGRVEEATDNRLTVRGGLPLRRRRVVLATEIDDVDQTSGVIALRVERGTLRTP